MKEPFRLEGGDEVLAALDQLPKATRRNVLKRTLQEAISPIAQGVKARAPVLWGDLEEDLHIGTKLNRRQAALNRADKATVELHFGTSDPAGIANEFGNSHQRANPFFRSEWEGGKHRALATIAKRLGEEVMSATARVRRKAERKR